MNASITASFLLNAARERHALGQGCRKRKGPVATRGGSQLADLCVSSSVLISSKGNQTGHYAESGLRYWR